MAGTTRISYKCTLFSSHNVSFCLLVCFKLSQYWRVRYFIHKSHIWFFSWKVKRSGNSGRNSNVKWQLFIKAQWWLLPINKYVLSTEPQSLPLSPVLSFSCQLAPGGISALILGWGAILISQVSRTNFFKRNFSSRRFSCKENRLLWQIGVSWTKCSLNYKIKFLRKKLITRETKSGWIINKMCFH